MDVRHPNGGESWGMKERSGGRHHGVWLRDWEEGVAETEMGKR